MHTVRTKPPPARQLPMARRDNALDGNLLDRWCHGGAEPASLAGDEHVAAD
jgi:hypothetical protein